jgi:hypothetical protein
MTGFMEPKPVIPHACVLHPSLAERFAAGTFGAKEQNDEESRFLLANALAETRIAVSQNRDPSLHAHHIWVRSPVAQDTS